MVEELAEGFFHVARVLLRGIAHLLLEIIKELILERLVELFGRGVRAIWRGSVFLARRVFYAVDRLYRAVLRRTARQFRHPALAHGLAVALLTVCGFLFGFGTSMIYHHNPVIRTAASSFDAP